MPVKIRADIPVSLLEYQATYREPFLDLQRFQSEVVPAAFRGFRRFGVSLENVSYKKDPANLGEIAVAFAIQGGRLTFTVRLGSVSLQVPNPNWSEEAWITDVVKAGLAATMLTDAVVLDVQRATLLLHLVPAQGSIKDLVAPLVRPTANELTGDSVRSYGFSGYKERSLWVVDPSVLINGALFVRIDQHAGNDVPFEDLASKLKADEVRLLELLTVEVT